MSFPRISERTTHRLIFVVLLAAAAALYWRIFEIRPLRGDNLYVLAWVHTHPFSALTTIDPAIYPEWRPLAYLTVWIEHHLVHLDGVAVHWGVNLLLWTVSAWLVYRITVALTQSPIAGLAAGLLLLVDRRIEEPLTWIIGRQTLLACLFGLTALFVLLVRGRDRALSRREWLLIGGLLLASALSKEYGVAFALAIGVHGAWSRNRIQAIAAVAPLALYVVLRVGLAGGAVGNPYCESMGYLYTVEDQCVDPVTATGLDQMAYNVVASVAGTLVPGLMTETGEVEIARRRVALNLAVLLLAALGLQRMSSRVAIPLALLPVATGLMNFMVYRSRNQVIGATGVVILAGLGLAAVLRETSTSPWARARTIAAMGAIVLMLAVEARYSQMKVELAVVEMLDQDPCDSSVRTRDFGDRFAKLVKHTYDMPDPTCVGSP